MNVYLQNTLIIAKGKENANIIHTVVSMEPVPGQVNSKLEKDTSKSFCDFF